MRENVNSDAVLAKREAELERQLKPYQKLVKQLEEVKIARRVLRRLGQEAAGGMTPAELEQYRRDYGHLSQMRAIIKMAKDSGNNRLSVRKARRILEAIGKLHSSKQASRIVYKKIVNSGLFKHVGIGEYELITTKEPIEKQPIPIAR